MAVHEQGFPWKPSFWATESVMPENPLDERDLRTDVVIVGGGYAGMSCAYYIKKAKPELSVALLESEYIGFGPSGRNFGGVAPGVRELRAGIIDLPDREEERFSVSWFLKCRDELERRIAEGGIECEYRNEPILMQALDEAAWEALQRESEILKDRGTPHELLDQQAINAAMALPYRPLGGIVRTSWRATQPFKLARGLGRQLREMGVAVHEGTRVTEINDDGTTVIVKTSGGGSVTAGKAVLATNAYTCHLPQFADVIFPRHTYVIATEVLEPAIFASLGFNEYKFVEDSGFIFYYSRVYQGRLLFGGGEPTTGFFTPSTVDEAADKAQAEYARLYEEMVSRWPQLQGVKVETAWSGPIDITENFAPIIRQHDAMKNLTLCVGYNGEGLTSGCMTGLMALGPVLGSEFADPDAERVRQYLQRPVD